MIKASLFWDTQTRLYRWALVPAPPTAAILNEMEGVEYLGTYIMTANVDGVEIGQNIDGEILLEYKGELASTHTDGNHLLCKRGAIAQYPRMWALFSNGARVTLRPVKALD